MVDAREVEVRPPYPQLCMALHPDGVTYCTLPCGPDLTEHDGPHGWDYAAGERAVITRRQIQEKLRAGGLGDLADRLGRLSSTEQEAGRG